jgi:hypothetical protein
VGRADHLVVPWCAERPTRAHPARPSPATTVWVASGSSSPYLPVNALGKAASGTVDFVDVAVTKIETQDANWQNRTFYVDSPSVRIYAPKV